MQYQITDSEWEKLHDLLNEPIHNLMARRSAQACIYRFTHRLSKHYRTFSWAMIPNEFMVSGQTAHRYYTKWVDSGSWFDFWDMLIVERYGRAIPTKPNKKQLKKASPLVATISELERAYAYFNHRFLANTLPSSIRITIERTAKPRLHGYFVERIWQSDNNHGHHIALCQSALGHSEMALEVLLHEMAHAKNAVHDLEDTDSRTQYHTIDFRDTAQLLGLSCEKVPNRGFAHTELGNRALDAIAILKPVEDVFLAMKAY